MGETRWLLPALSWLRFVVMMTANVMLWRHEDLRALLCLVLWLGITVEYRAIRAELAEGER